MTQNVPLNHGDIAIEPFFDAIQEILSASAPSFYLTILNSTTIRAVAGTENTLNAISIQGRYRYRTTNVDAIHPGGAAGTYGVWATATDNSFSSVPTEDKTNYTWGLVILSTGSTPGTPIYRKVADVDWNGTAITSLRHLTGIRRDDAPIFATTPLTNVVPLKVRGIASQTSSLQLWENGGGIAVAWMGPSGTLNTTGGMADSSTAGLTLSGSGGKTTLKLSSAELNTGITIGSDTNLYRSAPNTLQTDDNLTVLGTLNPSGGLTAGSIKATALATSAVETAKIKDGNVTRVKLESIAKPVRWYSSLSSGEDYRQSTSFGLINPGQDIVENVTLPSGGLIIVLYSCHMRNEPATPAGVTATAAIFLNDQQLRVPDQTSGELVLQQTTKGGSGSPGYFAHLTSYWNGLIAGANSSIGTGPQDVGTGQAMGRLEGEGVIGAGGPCYIYADPGTYSVSVQYKSSNASWGAGGRDRRLYVGVIGNNS